MSSQATQHQKLLRQLTLQSAKAALLTFGSQSRPTAQDIADIKELADEYAFRAIILWLLAELLGSVPAADEVERAFSESAEYPFLNCLNAQSFQVFRMEAFDLLGGVAACADASAEILGTYYEHIQKFSLEFDFAANRFEWQNGQDKSARRAVGQFYTPAKVVDYCWRKLLSACGLETDDGTVNPSSDFGSDFEQESTAGKTSAVQRAVVPKTLAVQLKIPLSGATSSQSTLAQPKIFDPSCGTGNFLLGYLRVASAQDHLNLPPGSRRSKAADLVSVATSNLHGSDIDGRAVSLCRLGIIITVLSSDQESIGTAGNGKEMTNQLLQALRQNIKVSDSVLQAADLNASSSDGFDIVITNPPYVSFGARNQPQIPVSWARYLRSVYPEGSEYKVRLHSIFQDLALRHCKPNGQAGLLVPDGFLTGSYYARLRKLLLQTCQIESIAELPTDTISGAVVGRWCFAVYRNQTPSAPYEIQISSTNSGKEQRYVLAQSSFVSPDTRFRILLNEMDERLCVITDRLPMLSTVIRGHTGIRALHGQESICADQRRTPDWQKGLRSGSSVIPYLVTWDQTWLHVNKNLLYGGGFNANVIEKEKILVRQTGDRLTAAVDSSGLYHLNNLHSLQLLDDSVSIHFLTALLNSTFWLYLYRLKTREEGRAMAQIDIETLESMPLPKRHVAKEQGLAKLAQRLASSRLDQHERVALMRQVDSLIYSLYQLNESFVAHIEAECGTLRPHGKREQKHSQPPPLAGRKRNVSQRSSVVRG